MNRKTQFKLAMIEKNLTVEEAAKVCGYTKNTLYQYLAKSRKDRIPSQEKINLILEVDNAV